MEPVRFWIDLCCAHQKPALTSEALDFDPQAHAVNVLDGRLYQHHPVLRQVPLRAYAIDRDHLTEWNGLRVPAAVVPCDYVRISVMVTNTGNVTSRVPFLSRVSPLTLADQR